VLRESADLSGEGVDDERQEEGGDHGEQDHPEASSPSTERANLDIAAESHRPWLPAPPVEQPAAVSPVRVISVQSCLTIVFGRTDGALIIPVSLNEGDTDAQSSCSDRPHRRSRPRSGS